MALDPLVELRGLHDPPTTVGTLLADGMVALAIGLLIAWFVVQIVKVFSAREISPENRALLHLAALKEREDDHGLAARATLLLELGSTLPREEGDMLVRVDRHLGGFLTTGAGKGLRDALYRPGASLDIPQFDRELEASLRRAVH